MSLHATPSHQPVSSSWSSSIGSAEMGRNTTGSQGLPSPTLTNPDMVLPDRDSSNIPALPPTPPRDVLPDRPPSVTYLREQASAPSLRDVGSMGSIRTAAGPKREKRGLMSRKMMLLRSRTASTSAQIPRSAPAEQQQQHQTEDYEDIYASSPTLMDVGNLLPESPTPQERRPSTGMEDFSDDELVGMPQFLAKYDSKDAVPSDDEFDESSPAGERYGYSVSIEGGLEEKRRKQEQDEQNSAILSKRAEAILANAKKRLNLMEGNLRGARDLVAPLTAANLKRATSVSSSHVTPASIYGNRSRPIYDGYHYDTAPQRTNRKLQAQASSPTMGREFQQGHSRGFSTTEIPERPYTSMERTNSPVRHVGGVGRFPVKAQESPLGGSLRGSRSYDSLGSHAGRGAVPRAVSGRRGSPDSNLEPLAEDDDTYHPVNGQSGRSSASPQEYDHLGRPVSRTEDLREQMSSLRGRISSLKERAREDSLRRQSMQNLREPSPLNNASVNAPEYFYTSSPSYGSPTLDTNAGKGWKSSQENSPNTPQSIGKALDLPTMYIGSRNAFAEQPQQLHRPNSRSQRYSRGSPEKLQRAESRTSTEQTLQPPQSHSRTPSGTAIVKSSKHRYSHHQFNGSSEMPGAFEIPSPDESTNGELSNGLGIRGADGHYDAQSNAGASEYEDAPTEQVTPAVVAHEDREDAFDYEHFFLHSAMGTYGIGGEHRSSSPVSSEASDTSSVETTKGPTAIRDDDDDLDDDDYDHLQDFTPPTPETPEKLREIERNLHKRTLSAESVSTIATFATATEGREESPERNSVFGAGTPNEWPLPPMTGMMGSRSAPSSRPATAVPVARTNGFDFGVNGDVKAQSRHHQHRSSADDDASDRADSGVGGLAGSTSTTDATPRATLNGKTGHHHHQKSAPASILHQQHPSHHPAHSPSTSHSHSFPRATPPLSPTTTTSSSRTVNPATAAVNALLEPSAKPLGLREKALLFGVVEQLRAVTRALQEKRGTGEEAREMVGRLERVGVLLGGG